MKPLTGHLALICSVPCIAAMAALCQPFAAEPLAKVALLDVITRRSDTMLPCPTQLQHLPIHGCMKPRSCPAGSVAAGSTRVQLKLLQACLTVVPSSLRQLKGLAEALEGLLLSCASEPDSSSQLLYEIGCCCALLPAATGETCWMLAGSHCHGLP